MSIARFLALAPPAPRAPDADLEAIARLGLGELAAGRPATLYHGTTALFDAFDEARCRAELVEQFYGAGVFFSPSWRVAARYAWAARNRVLPASIVDDLGASKPGAAAFLRVILAEGRAGWGRALREAGCLREAPRPGEGSVDVDALERALGCDANRVADLAPYIEGSAEPETGGEDLFAALTGGHAGAPLWVYDNIDSLGLDSARYRPKVYAAAVTARSPALARDEGAARAAFARGHDCVVYVGRRAVEDVPEVAVRRGDSARVLSVELA